MRSNQNEDVELSQEDRQEVVAMLVKEIERLKEAYGLETSTSKKDVTIETTLNAKGKKLRKSVVTTAQDRIRSISAIALDVKTNPNPIFAKKLYAELDELKKQMKSTGSSSRLSFKSRFFVTGRDKINMIMQFVNSKKVEAQKNKSHSKTTKNESKPAATDEKKQTITYEQAFEAYMGFQEQVMSFLKNPKQAMPATMATFLYSETVGTGESLQKKYADMIISHIETSLASIDHNQLAALTAAVMEAQANKQVTDPKEPFLRRTGVITDRLYALCVRHPNYSPDSEMMNLVHQNILKGKGYNSKEPRNTSNNALAIKNALIEIEFKISSAAKIGTSKLNELADKLSSPQQEPTVRIRL